jgi:hypothetical protein
MIIPFFIGLREIILNHQNTVMKLILIILIISPIPAALTKDPFSTLKALPLFWSLTIVISLGIQKMLNIIKKNSLKLIVSLVIIIFSLNSLISSYFVIFRIERAKYWAYGYKELSGKIATMHDKNFVIDTERTLPSYILFAFYNKYDPNKLQTTHDTKILNNYYNEINFNQPSRLDPNINLRPINWGEDIYQKQVLVGDLLAISVEQIKEHKLGILFEIKDLQGEILFRGYLTNPNEKCVSEKAIRKIISRHCILF